MITTRVQCPECDYWANVPADMLTDWGAPVCPVHGTSMMTGHDFSLAAQRAKELRQTDKPKSLTQFLALRGGVQPSADLLQTMGRYGLKMGRSWIKGGRGQLCTSKATLTVSEAHMEAMEAGYLPDDSYESDFLDSLDECLSGCAVYPINERGDAALLQEGI